ncbi:MAG: hypothetical protein V3R77_07280 [Candidatus Binatia bacterium]
MATGPVHQAHGDAIVRSQAMLASTIAEIFVEPGRVRVELEIGGADLQAFRRLLPDDVYEKLGNAPLPLASRLPEFFTQDLFIHGPDGKPLEGRLLAIGPRQRLARDDVSGEPLPVEPGREEMAVFAELEYRFEGQPAELLIGAATRPQAQIGFVAYDRSVAVNDFRYLGPRQVLSIDWNDPWYTSFATRNLRRSYSAPMSGFLYVDPFEVRKEIILRPLDLQPWIDLGLEGVRTIPVDVQPELERKVAEFLRGRQPVLIDGIAIDPELARVNFLERTLTSSRVIEPREELDVYSAILGVIFVYPLDGLPQTVTMRWDLFNDRIARVPAASVDQAGPLPILLEPDYDVLEWRNFLKNPQVPALVVIARPPTPLERTAAAARLPAAAIALAVSAWCAIAVRRRRVPALRATAIGLAVAAIALVVFRLGGTGSVDESRARAVAEGLLRNVYHAFDFREEERIYDTLEASVAGDLLTQIYLETQRGLELASQGGARAKVKNVELVELTAEPGRGGAIEVDATWKVFGSVGHWGHVHQRANRYRALLDLVPIDGAWKLAGMDILEEQRL